MRHSFTSVKALKEFVNGLGTHHKGEPHYELFTPVMDSDDLDVFRGVLTHMLETCDGAVTAQSLCHNIRQACSGRKAASRRFNQAVAAGVFADIATREVEYGTVVFRALAPTCGNEERGESPVKDDDDVETRLETPAMFSDEAELYEGILKDIAVRTRGAALVEVVIGAIEIHPDGGRAAVDRFLALVAAGEFKKYIYAVTFDGSQYLMNTTFE
jgi:hypothetical protein